MKIQSVLVRKPDIRIIDIDTGARKQLVAGNTYAMEPAVTDREFSVIRGTRYGAIHPFWKTLEEQGKVELSWEHEQHDPVIDGIRLPITSRSQLTDQQYRHLEIGKLVKGKFHCFACAVKGGHEYPQSIPIMPIHILPYSQRCGVCGLQIVAIWRSAKGSWLNLHD